LAQLSNFSIRNRNRRALSGRVSHNGCNTRSTSARGLELLILTAVRSNEIRAAEWSEFDLASKTWTIPAHRMKSRREHRVPLSNRAHWPKVME
jgi:integrase